MKALSIKQPYAWLICSGFKDVDNRDWPTKFRGRIYVHAGKKTDDIRETGDFISRLLTDEQFSAHLQADWALGAIIGEVDIVDCKYRFGEENDNLYSKWHIPGSYGFVLANPVLYDKPIPYRGQLGFFEVTLPKP